MKFLVIHRPAASPFVVWEDRDLIEGDAYDDDAIVVSEISLSECGLHSAEIDQLHSLLSFDDVRRLFLHTLDAAYLQGHRDQRMETKNTLRSLIEE